MPNPAVDYPHPNFQTLHAIDFAGHRRQTHTGRLKLSFISIEALQYFEFFFFNWGKFMKCSILCNHDIEFKKSRRIKNAY